jgi:acyl-CoA thioester hydrolase
MPRQPAVFPDVFPVPAFTWPIRIYFENTDAGGVVYHSEYLKFFERTRTEWLRSLGIHNSVVGRDLDAVFVVVDVAMRLRQAARLDDELTATLAIEHLGRAQATVVQTLTRTDNAQARLVEARLTLACVSLSNFRPKGIPPALRYRMTQALATDQPETSLSAFQS